MSDIQGIVTFDTVQGGTAYSTYCGTIHGGSAGTKDVNYDPENLDGGSTDSTY